MGYYRPISEWNIGKVSEYQERKFYTESNAIKRIQEIELIKNLNNAAM